MAVKTYYVPTTNDGNFAALVDGTVQAAANRTDGWTVAKLAAAQMAEFDAGTKQASTAFSSATKPASFLTGATANAFKTPAPLTGTFAATSWTFNIRVRATVASSQAGRMRMRIFKSVNADGSGATELTGATLVGATTTALSTTADVASQVSWNPGTTVTLNNEYLFFVIAWEITTAAGSNTADVQIRSGQTGSAGTFFSLPDFTASSTVAIGRETSNTVVRGVTVGAEIRTIALGTPATLKLADNFNRADQNPAVGWTYAPVGVGNTLIIIGNKIASPGASQPGAAFYNLASLDSEPSVQAKIVESTMQHSVIMSYLLSDNSGYMAYVGSNMIIYRIDNGSLTILKVVGANVYAAGDTLGIRRKGSSVEMLRNGVVIDSVVDTNYMRSGSFAGLSTGGSEYSFDDFYIGGKSSTVVRGVTPSFAPGPAPDYTTLIDNFNRTNDASVLAGAGSTVWSDDGLSTPGPGQNGLLIKSQGVGISFVAAAGIVKKFFKSDFDLLMDVAVAAPMGSITFYTNLTAVGTANWNGVAISWDSGSNAWYCTVYRNGSATGGYLGGSDPVTPPAVGDTIYLRKRGTQISVTKQVGGTGPWLTLAGWDLSAFPTVSDSEGQWGLYCGNNTAALDNLRGGPEVAPVYTTLIDDYNRANGAIYAGAGAAIWSPTALFGGAEEATVTGNQMAVPRNWDTAMLKDLHGVDCDFQLDCAVAGTAGIGLTLCAVQLQAGSAATVDALQAVWSPGSGGQWYWNTITDGASNSTGHITAPGPVAGDTFWIAKRGAIITLYRKPSGGSYAPVISGSFPALATVQGQFGIAIKDSTARWDNLRGGPLVGPPQTVAIGKVPAILKQLNGTVGFNFGNLATNTRLAQPFVAQGGKLTRVITFMNRVGTPVDSWAMEVWSDSAGSPGSLVHTIAITSLVSGWQTLDYQNLSYALTPGATYWLVVRRTGAVDASNYTIASGSSTPVAGWNTMKVYDSTGPGWVADPLGRLLDVQIEVQATQVRGVTLSGSGTATPILIGKKANATSVKGVTPARSGEQTLAIGKKTNITSVKGVTIAASGAVAVTIGKETNATIIRGVTVVASGAAPVAIGKKTNASVVRGITFPPDTSTIAIGKVSNVAGPDERMLSANPNSTDPGGVYSLGVKFLCTADGQITHIRYWAQFAGARTLSVWNTSTTAKLATVNDTAPGIGYREVALTTPLNVVAGVNYSVTHSFNGTFAYTLNQTNPGSLAPHLTGYTPMYAAAADTFPNVTGGHTYHTDVVYHTTGASVKGVTVAPSGAAPVAIGKKLNISSVKGVTVAPTGAAPIIVGKKTNATVVRGVTPSGSGTITLAIGKKLVNTTIRGATVTGSGVVTFAIGRVGGGAAYKSAVLADIPVSYWRLNETAGTMADEKGVTAGTHLSSLARGVSGLLTGDTDKALQLDGGTGQGVLIGNTAPYQLNDVTLEAWIKTSVNDAIYRSILVKQFAYGMFVKDGVLNVYEWGAGSPIARGGSVVDGARHHVVVVLSGTSAAYIDGVQAGATWVHSITDQSTALMIGTNSGPSQEWSGVLDEVAIYNTLLSPAQILAHYNAGITGGGSTSTVRGVTLTSTLSVLPIGKKLNATSVKGVTVAASGAAPITIGKRTNGTVILGVAVSPTGAASLVIGRVAFVTSVKGVTVSGSGTASPVAIGKKINATVVRGATVSGSGTATPVVIGKVAAATTVRGLTLAPTGAAPVLIGKKLNATLVKGVTVAAAGTVSVTIGNKVAATVVRGVTFAPGAVTVAIGTRLALTVVRGLNLAPGGAAPIVIGKRTVLTTVRGLTFAGTGDAPLPIGKRTNASIIRGVTLVVAGAAPVLIGKKLVNTTVRGVTAAGSGAALITIGKKLNSTLVLGVFFPGGLRIGWSAPAGVVRGLGFVVSGTVPITVGKKTNSTVVRGLGVSGSGTMPIVIGKKLNITVTRGVTLIPGPVSFGVGKVPQATSVRGLGITYTQFVLIGKKANSTVTRGVTFVASGTANLLIGKRGAATTVRGVTSIATGAAQLAVGQVNSTTAVRGVYVIAVGGVPLAVGRVQAHTTVYGVDVRAVSPWLPYRTGEVRYNGRAGYINGVSRSGRVSSRGRTG